MPSPPISWGSSKEVRFSPTPVTGSTRPLALPETYSLRNLEEHAAVCWHCYQPYDGYKSNRYMCSHGQALARDSGMLVEYKKGELYTKTSDQYGKARLELGGNYNNALQAMKLIHKHGKHAFTPQSSSHRQSQSDKKHKSKRKHSEHGSSSRRDSTLDESSFDYRHEALSWVPFAHNTRVAAVPHYQYTQFTPDMDRRRDDGRSARPLEQAYQCQRRSDSTGATVGERDAYFAVDFVPRRHS